MLSYAINFIEVKYFMVILGSNLNKLNGLYRFNMTNYNNEKFKALGLEPSYLILYPRYINLEGNIFGTTSTLHKEFNLTNDIKNILTVMNSNIYGRYDKPANSFLRDNHSFSFSICNHQIFFDDLMSLSIYKNNLNIRNEINKKFNLKNEFYEPTEREIYQCYVEEYIRKWCIGHEYKEDYTFNLTPAEYFELMISSQKRNLKPYTNSNDLSGYDIRYWLNHNANIFLNHKCSWDTTGVYNEETKNYINSILQTKLDIYDFFYKFSRQAKNWQQAIKELLTAFNIYHEFVKVERDPLNPFCDDSDYAERNYWDKMFYKSSFDMLVQFIGFDKIETQRYKTITTSKSNIYEVFFNLLIMEYNIVQLPRLVFDEETQHFRWIYPNKFTNCGINRECENEIKLIKKYIPYEERYKFFRE